MVSWPVEAAGTAGAVIEEAGSSRELAGDRVASPGAVMAMLEDVDADDADCC